MPYTYPLGDDIFSVSMSPVLTPDTCKVPLHRRINTAHILKIGLNERL